MELTYRYSNKATQRHIDYNNENFFLDKPLESVTIHNGIILPQKYCKDLAFGLGGVIDESGCFVKESANPAKGMQPRFGGKYSFSKLEQLSLEEVIYLGPITKHWGHFLVDMISRLWFTLNCSNIETKTFAYCGFNMEEGGIHGNYLRFFELLGIHGKQLIDIRVATKLRKIIVPELSFVPGKYYTSDFKKIFDRIIENCPKSNLGNNEIVYFTRKFFPSAFQRESGENLICNFFQSNGCQVYAPEKLTLDEQINLWNNAKKVICISGTIPHNILFLNTNEFISSEKVIILNKTSLLNEHQIFINKIKSIEPIYIDAYFEPFSHFPVSAGYGPFWLGLTKPLKLYAQMNNFKTLVPQSLTLQNMINFLKYICNIFIYYIKFPIRLFFNTTVGSHIKRKLRRLRYEK